MNYLNFMFSRCKQITNMRRRLVLFETVSSKQYDYLDKLLPRDTSECFKKVIVCITISFSSPLIKDRIIRMFGKRSKPVRVIQHELNCCFPVALGGARVGYYLPYVGLVHRYGVGPREPLADVAGGDPPDRGACDLGCVHPSLGPLGTGGRRHCVVLSLPSEASLMVVVS